MAKILNKEKEIIVEFNLGEYPYRTIHDMPNHAGFTYLVLTQDEYEFARKFVEFFDYFDNMPKEKTPHLPRFARMKVEIE